MSDTGKTPELRHYKLTRRFWNGKTELPVGTVEPFVEGTQPKTAVLVETPELVVAEPKPAEKPSKEKG